MANMTKVISNKSTRLKGIQKSFNISIDKKIGNAKADGKTFKTAELVAEKSATNAYYDSIIASYEKIEDQLLNNIKE